jgi:hypothetical protein
VLLLLPRQKGESEQRSKTKAGVAAAAVLLLPDIVVGKRLWGQFHAMEKLGPWLLSSLSTLLCLYALGRAFGFGGGSVQCVCLGDSANDGLCWPGGKCKLWLSYLYLSPQSSLHLDHRQIKNRELDHAVTCSCY